MSGLGKGKDGRSRVELLYQILCEKGSCFIPMSGYINLGSVQSMDEECWDGSTALPLSSQEEGQGQHYDRSAFSQSARTICRVMAIIVLLFIFVALSVIASPFDSERDVIREIATFLEKAEDGQSIDLTLKQHLEQQQIGDGLLKSVQPQPLLVPSKPQYQKFIIPKRVWIFIESPQKQSYFVQRCINNIKWFSSKSGFELYMVNSKNYGQWLPKDRKQKVEEALKHLKNSKDATSAEGRLKVQIIMMEILLEKGGVVMEKNLILTQDFTWLERINENVYVNRARKDSKAQYFGFFHLDYGTFYSKADKDARYETERYMITYPGLLGLFMAGVAHGAYLEQTMPWFYKIIQQPKMAKQLMKTHNIFAGNITGKDPYREAFVIASHIVLQTKQRELNLENTGRTIYAIDYYGLLTINSRYFPTKLEAFFQGSFQEKLYKNLAKYSLFELQQSAGPLRYVVSLFFQQHMNYRLEEARKGNRYYYMHPDSFFATYLFMDGKYSFIEQQYEKSIVNITAKRWESLPRIVWLFWDTGISKSPLANKLCVENIRKNAEEAGFQIRMVNNSNIESYIGSETIARIDNIAESRKISIYAPMKSNFYRIALMAKYGGVYMDVSFFMVEGFNWLLDIAKFPSQFIFNRYGELPKMFMFFHPHYGSLFQWQYDPQANTKMAWLASYQNNLIVGEPNLELLEDWFDNYEEFITSPYADSERLMKQLKVQSSRWTSSKHTYLAAMESLRITFGLKQRQILLKPASHKGPKSAPEYYGIWSMSGFRGQQKFRPNTNYDKNNFRDPYSYDNFFLYRYSKAYTDGVIGQVHQMGKFYRWTIKHLTKFIEDNADDGFRAEAHPESYFMRFIYDTSRLRIERREGELVIVR